MSESRGFGERLAGALAMHGGLCLGIDPHAHLLDVWGLPDTADGAREFGLRAVEAAAGIVGVVKPQIAFYERHGAGGYAGLERVLASARDAGLLVIGDVKRGDMGTSFEAYAESWLTPGSTLEVDAMTVNAFQGVGVLEPGFRLAEAHGKGLYVLVATSNPEARELQLATVPGGGTVSAAILEGVQQRNAVPDGELGSFGAVVGATLDPVEFGLDLAAAPSVSILGPGFGAQGAALRDVRRIYGDAASRVLASVSRDALAAGPDRLGARLVELRDELERGLA